MIINNMMRKKINVNKIIFKILTILDFKNIIFIFLNNKTN